MLAIIRCSVQGWTGIDVIIKSSSALNCVRTGFRAKLLWWEGWEHFQHLLACYMKTPCQLPYMKLGHINANELCRKNLKRVQNKKCSSPLHCIAVPSPKRGERLPQITHKHLRTYYSNATMEIGASMRRHSFPFWWWEENEISHLVFNISSSGRAPISNKKRPCHLEI